MKYQLFDLSNVHVGNSGICNVKQHDQFFELLPSLSGILCTDWSVYMSVYVSVCMYKSVFIEVR